MQTSRKATLTTLSCPIWGIDHRFDNHYCDNDKRLVGQVTSPSQSLLLSNFFLHTHVLSNSTMSYRPEEHRDYLIEA